MSEYNTQYEHTTKGQFVPLGKVFGIATLTEHFIKMIQALLEVVMFEVFAKVAAQMLTLFLSTVESRCERLSA